MMRFQIAIVAAAMLWVAQANAEDISRPDVFQFGSTVSDMQRRLQPFCASLKVRPITPITAPLARYSQVQIDCQGFAYAGQPRKVELVFQDDQLDIVWVLFDEAERPRLLSAFKASLGEPTLENDFGTIFLKANVALRNKPAEVLFASDRQVEVFMKALGRAAPAAAP